MSAARASMYAATLVLRKVCTSLLALNDARPVRAESSRMAAVVLAGMVGAMFVEAAAAAVAELATAACVDAVLEAATVCCVGPVTAKIGCGLFGTAAAAAALPLAAAVCIVEC